MIHLVMVNYHTPHDVRRFIGSYRENPPEAPHHLTVVHVAATSQDIASTDTWSDQPHVEVLTSIDNIGYARACNRAAFENTTDEDRYVVFFNADVRLRKGAVDECVDALEQNSEWGVLGPRQVDSKNRLTHAGIFGTPTKPQHRAWHGWDNGRYSDVREAVTVSGAAYFVRSETWKELTVCPTYRFIAPEATGAFLPTPHYFEETFCSYHARAHGWKVVYYGPACIEHEWHQASPVGGWAERQFGVSQKLFREACEKHNIEHD
jgi:GT2 family glycosyltransferase